LRISQLGYTSNLTIIVGYSNSHQQRKFNTSFKPDTVIEGHE